MATVGWHGSKHGFEFFVPEASRYQWLASGGVVHSEIRVEGDVVHPQPLAACVRLPSETTQAVEPAHLLPSQAPPPGRPSVKRRRP